jgi:hypothetical protein
MNGDLSSVLGKKFFVILHKLSTAKIADCPAEPNFARLNPGRASELFLCNMHKGWGQQ